MADASLQVLRDGRGRVKAYRVRWRNRPGVTPQQPSKTFGPGQKQLAEAFLAQIRFNMAATRSGLTAQSKMTLEGLYAQYYLPASMSTRATTKASRTTLWEKWIKPALGAQQVGDITAMDIEALVNKIVREGKYETAKKVRALLVSVFAIALKLSLVSRNVAASTSVVSRPQDAGGRSGASNIPVVDDDDDSEADVDDIPVFFMSIDVVASILGAIEVHFRPLVLTLASTGMRVGEAAALRVQDVDLTKRSIAVARTMTVVSRRHRVRAGQKIENVSPARRTKVKQAASRRRVPISPELCELLKPLVDDRAPGEPLFTMVKGAQLDVHNFRRRYWHPSVVAAACVKRWRVHDLRHFAASVLFEAGISEIQIAAHLGHKNSNITRRVYAHLLKPDTAEAAVALATPLTELMRGSGSHMHSDNDAPK